MILHKPTLPDIRVGMDDHEIDRRYAEAFDLLAAGWMPSTTDAAIANIYERLRIMQEREARGE